MELDAKTKIYILETENEVLRDKVKKLEKDIEEYLDLHNLVRYHAHTKLSKEK